MASLPAHARSRRLRSRWRQIALKRAALFVLGTGLLACSAPESSGTSLQQRGQALSGAQIDRDHSGALALVTVTQEQVELCTVTLLTPNLVATARHCVAPSSSDSVVCTNDPGSFSAPYPASRLWVNHARALQDSLGSYGLLAITGGSAEFVAVANVDVPDTSRVCGGDLALLTLERELDADEATPFLPRLDRAPEPGEPYTAVGFGDTPSASQQGTRRSRSGLQVACTGAGCDPSAGVEASEFLGGDGVCSGDSGGPALDAAGRVVGIASRSQDCTHSVYSAVSSWSDFIREVAARATRAGSYDDPEWLVAPPPVPPAAEPSSMAAPDADAAPEPTAPAVEENGDDPADDGAGDEALRPTPPNAGSSAAGGSGCSVSGGGPRAPLGSLLACLGALTLQQLRRARRRGARLTLLHTP